MTTIGYKADQKTIQKLLNLYEKDHLNLEPGLQHSSVWAAITNADNRPLMKVSWGERRIDHGGEH